MADWFGIMAIVIAGLFALFGVFNKNLKFKKAESDKVDDRLINLLKETVGGLEKKVEILEEQQKINVAEIGLLKTENEVMKKIFQGRDSSTIEYQKRGSEAIDKIDAILSMASTTNKNIERLTFLLTDYFKANPIKK